MESKNLEEYNTFNKKYDENNKEKQINLLIRKLYYLLFIFTFINLMIFISNYFHKSPLIENKRDKIIHEKNIKNSDKTTVSSDIIPNLLSKEKGRLILKEINKKRTFEKRFPLPKEIKCNTHFTKNELVGFLSFLTKDTIFFETGSGCSSVFAKYYTKKSYAIEGCKEWYDKGVKKGLEENLIFHDLKPDNPTWSYPGKNSNINDWKQYFQAYDSKYNADIIFIDGRFKVATAMDIFNKIRNDTIVLIHEYQQRPIYFILENYYQYVNSLII